MENRISGLRWFANKVMLAYVLVTILGILWSVVVGNLILGFVFVGLLILAFLIWVEWRNS